MVLDNWTIKSGLSSIKLTQINVCEESLSFIRQPQREEETLIAWELLGLNPSPLDAYLPTPGCVNLEKFLDLSKYLFISLWRGDG